MRGAGPLQLSGMGLEGLVNKVSRRVRAPVRAGSVHACPARSDHENRTRDTSSLCMRTEEG
eukprot:7476-Eustigmatos_ZCMA.PRE.1